MKNYILALDEGTTSARSILFDRDMNVIAIAQNEIPQIFPKPGWVEQDPLEIYASQYASMTECVARSGISPDEIAAVGITNQRETTIVWEKSTGRPVYNAIVWQCRRTAPICAGLEKAGLAEKISEKTGLKIDAYFSGTKIKWILDNVPGAREKAEAGELLFGTVDTWLMWKLSGGRIHLTDNTNASRTMLYGLASCDWDDELLDILRIPKPMLPGIRASGSFYGEINLMGTALPVCGVAGDQQSALFGQCCFGPGEMKNTYGTGCFLLANTGGNIVRSQHGLITTAAATLSGESHAYALEGSVFVGGAVIKWLRDGMRLIDEAHDTEYFARKIKDTGGVYMVPAFSGLGAPYWDMNALGTIVGITGGTRRSHIIRAALESIAYQTDDVIRSVSKDAGEAPASLKVDGGASANDFLMQFQADISNTTVIRAEMKEATAAGAAYLAGLTAGIFRNRDEIKSLSGVKRTFLPEMSEEERERKLDGWHRAVRACRSY
ncbi:MAG: glycerol kinase GlpK [Clostridia bacterium]|nr:glycerol kinase GlpK [Clostridia bacterium]